MIVHATCIIDSGFIKTLCGLQKVSLRLSMNKKLGNQLDLCLDYIDHKSKAGLNMCQLGAIFVLKIYFK